MTTLEKYLEKAVNGERVKQRTKFKTLEVGEIFSLKLKSTLDDKSLGSILEKVFPREVEKNGESFIANAKNKGALTETFYRVPEDQEVILIK